MPSASSDDVLSFLYRYRLGATTGSLALGARVGMACDSFSVSRFLARHPAPVRSPQTWLPVQPETESEESRWVAIGPSKEILRRMNAGVDREVAGHQSCDRRLNASNCGWAVPNGSPKAIIIPPSFA
jgi:hypothetical protein